MNAKVVRPLVCREAPPPDARFQAQHGNEGVERANPAGQRDESTLPPGLRGHLLHRQAEDGWLKGMLLPSGTAKSDRYITDDVSRDSHGANEVVPSVVSDTHLGRESLAGFPLRLEPGA